MDFETAFELMKRGVSGALPEWGGYWKWDSRLKSVHIHCKDGSILDMRESQDMEFTLSHTFRKDWVAVDDESETEHAKNSGA